MGGLAHAKTIHLAQELPKIYLTEGTVWQVLLLVFSGLLVFCNLSEQAQIMLVLVPKILIFSKAWTWWTTKKFNENWTWIKEVKTADLHFYFLDKCSKVNKYPPPKIFFKYSFHRPIMFNRRNSFHGLHSLELVCLTFKHPGSFTVANYWKKFLLGSFAAGFTPSLTVIKNISFLYKLILLFASHFPSLVGYLAFCWESLRQLLHLVLNMIAFIVKGSYTIYLNFLYFLIKNV